MFEQQISIRMISERSRDTEDWSNDAENYIYIYIYIYIFKQFGLGLV